MNQMDHQFKIGVDDSVDHSTFYQNQFFKKSNNVVSKIFFHKFASECLALVSLFS